MILKVVNSTRAYRGDVQPSQAGQANGPLSTRLLVDCAKGAALVEKIATGDKMYTMPGTTDNFDGEMISAAAIRCGDLVFTGPTHFAALKKITLLALPATQRHEMMLNGVDGFVTDAGRVVSREEGFKIAKSSCQIVGELGDPERNKEFYGGDEPRLDSGIVGFFVPLKLRPNYLV